jgi:SAM-dependent methyltransferase
VNDRDVLYDLGCGDGRIVIAAAKDRGARGIGIDIDPERIRSCTLNALKAKVAGQVRFEVKSVFDVEIADATVVALYLLPWMNAQLRPKLLAELRPGTRIVAHQFPIAEWPPDKVFPFEGSDRIVYLWIVPAKISGRWSCTIRTPDGVRRRGTIDWEQEFQTVVATAILDGDECDIDHAILHGDKLAFEIKGVTYHAVVKGESMRGSGKRKGKRAELEIRARRD